MPTFNRQSRVLDAHALEYPLEDPLPFDRRGQGAIDVVKLSTAHEPAEEVVFLRQLRVSAIALQRFDEVVHA
mgnify:CR=1 FL=1